MNEVRTGQPIEQPTTSGLARWPANISLGFRFMDGRTRLSHRLHQGPLRVQKPFYPALPHSDECHVYLLHPPGGMAGRDDLAVNIDVGADATALITTPASAKAYRSIDGYSKLKQVFEVKGTFEWLPQDTILFGGSQLKQTTEVQLHAQARFCGWEIISIGRPASDDHYQTGGFRGTLSVFVDGKPLLRDRQQWQAGDAVLQAPWGLAGQNCLGTMLLYPGDKDLLETTRQLLKEHAMTHLGVTCVDHLLVIRALSDNPVKLQNQFRALWAALRQPAFGLPAMPPRIWNT